MLFAVTAHFLLLWGAIYYIMPSNTTGKRQASQSKTANSENSGKDSVGLSAADFTAAASDGKTGR